MSHDYTRRMHVDTRIGKECQIGAYSVILPGVTIWAIPDRSAPASVVMKDVPSNCLVAGNPARVMEKGIRTGMWGILLRDPIGKSEDAPGGAGHGRDQRPGRANAMIPIDLTDRVALVTGASRGIRARDGRDLLQAGGRVILNAAGTRRRRSPHSPVLN